MGLCSLLFISLSAEVTSIVGCSGGGVLWSSRGIVLYFMKVSLERGEGERTKRTRVSGESQVKCFKFMFLCLISLSRLIK